MKRALYFSVLTSLIIALTPLWASAQPVMYTSNNSDQSLYAVDHESAATSLVGPFNVPGAMAGLGYDPLSNTLYGTTTGTDNLYSINQATGNATLIGSLGVSHMDALGFDASTGTLYGAVGSEAGDGLYGISTTTGQASLIGHIGYFHDDHANTVRGLAVHPETHVLYGIVSGPATRWSALIEIDKITAQGTLIGTNQSHLGGLAFHPETSVLYGIDDSSGTLSRIDGITGATSLVAPTWLENPLGLTFTPEPTTLVLLALGLLIWSRRWR
jgi:hypothetical protein